ncbi:hypothetical protein JOE11_001798 [Robbsia andropogonis]|uniref:hypothetical protein n=1 Tax=Robbsia andropogonis TaxID=28092 RepID=UPI000697B63B|nr:hypothetical protein [Robbsia andropogonis]MCP1119201.1 hypothetical protein [Robbsia andropogonis]MCP1128948.1 hypothetical protein [Robbsia andropogonis]
MIVDAVAAPPAALISMSIRTVLTRCLLPICLGLHGIFCIAIEPASTVSASGATTLPLAAAGDVEEVPGASSASEQRGFATYANARYGYSIAYPDDLLTPGKEADDGDGLAFSAKTGGARVAVWGRYNATDDTPVALLQGEEEGACNGQPASYEVSKRDLVAFSCKTEDNEIVYEKMIIRDETLAVVSFTYPVAEQALWGPIITKMAGSLHLD